MEHLLLCVALLTGIALVSLDLSSMQFSTVGFHVVQDVNEHYICKIELINITFV